MDIKSRSFSQIIGWFAHVGLLLMVLSSIRLANYFPVTNIKTFWQLFRGQTSDYSQFVGYSPVYLQYAAFQFVGAFALCLLLSFVFRKQKLEADIFIAKWISKIWFEVKILLALTLIGGAIATFENGWNGGETLTGMAFLLVGLAVLWADLRVNGLKTVQHNSLNTLKRLWRRHMARMPFQKAMEFELWFTIISIGVLLFVTLIVAFSDAAPVIFLTALVMFIIAYRFVKRYMRLVESLGTLQAHLQDVEQGRLEKSLQLNEHEILYPVSIAVNGIQDGFVRALQTATKSERMKVELVTNVSHDLKTPLTSIISYAELLSRQELPAESREYLQIISTKSEQLKVLIQDLFDLSKSTSGILEQERDTIDLARLVTQTMADRGEVQRIQSKIRITDDPLWISCDGAKISRVLQNVFDNAEKYALDGTRIYVDACQKEGRAVLEIRNVANYEMTFQASDVLERFVRGDAARSAEGSGLGLSIARSFTMANGGTFEVAIEGDMFKVTITFPTVVGATPSADLEAVKM